MCGSGFLPGEVFNPKLAHIALSSSHNNCKDEFYTCPGPFERITDMLCSWNGKFKSLKMKVLLLRNFGVKNENGISFTIAACRLGRLRLVVVR